jgi:hypothetical protein
MSAQLIAFPTEQVRSRFEDAWSLLPSTMKTRSLSRAKLKPIWDGHAKRVGGQDRLLGALRAYLKGDKDLPKSGGPALDRWLKWEKYDHWLEGDNSVVSDNSGQIGVMKFPEPMRSLVVKATDEGWVRSYLDPCTYEDGWIRPKNGFAGSKLKEKAGILKAAGIAGMRPPV